MKRRRAVVVALTVLAFMVLHVVLVRSMAHGHVAHVLLGSGNALPPLGPAALAIALVLVRFVAIVLGPGALMAAASSLVADALERRAGRRRARAPSEEVKPAAAVRPTPTPTPTACPGPGR